MTGAVQRLRVIEAEWMEKSTQAAIDAAKAVIADNDINGRAMISSLNNLEWGWIAMAAVFAWIKTKSEQAVAEGQGYEQTIRAMPGYSPQPWEAGAVTSILPVLGDLQGVDWDKPVSEWSEAEMVCLCWRVHKLVGAALKARNEGSIDKIVQPSQAVAERELSARSGGSLLARGELEDDVHC
jgi:hypothetical protein